MTAENVLDGRALREPVTTNPSQDAIRGSSDLGPRGTGLSENFGYSKEEMTEKKAIPDSHPVDSTSEPSGQDVEAGGRKAALKLRLHRYYRLYFRHFLYAVIWLLFTG